MNKQSIIIGALWFATVVSYANWRIRSGGAESMPAWLRVLVSIAIFSLLWGFTTLAVNAPPSASGALRQLFALAAYILGIGSIFVLWNAAIFEVLAKPITSLIDGGDDRVVAKPFYSRAHAYRKRGDYDNALAEVEQQLQRFPGDIEGWLLWSEIQADDLKEPEAGVETLRTFLARDGVTPEQRALALQREADLLLHKLQDRGAARVVLERILEEFPGSESGRLAAQRLAHMPDAAHLAEGISRERKPLTLVHHEEKLGLTGDLGAAQAEAANAQDFDAEIQELVVHLVEHPDDWERRERLAALYAEHLGRPDLAHDQLERLVVTPGQPDRQVARWLNMIADLHLDDPDGLPAARLALDRIIGRFPRSAAAQMAEQRLALLSLEQRGQKPTRTLKIGKYPQKIGLEGRGPQSPLRARLPDLAPDPEEK